MLACNDEPYCVELVEGGEPGLDHFAFELHSECSLDDAAAHLDRLGVARDDRDGSLFVDDPDGRQVQVMPYREPVTDIARRPQHARPSSTVHLGGPRKLGHVNCLTGDIQAGVRFYAEVLGMRLSDWLGDAGVWFHVNSDHHVMALVDLGYAHFHHLAFDTVDIGKMRDLLDHLARHGRWVSWGPARHGIAGNIATYVRIPEEGCHVELYCDMEQLQDDHVPRVYPDDRYSSNTWGPLAAPLVLPLRPDRDRVGARTPTRPSDARCRPRRAPGELSRGRVGGARLGRALPRARRRAAGAGTGRARRHPRAASGTAARGGRAVRGSPS